ncbi:MAG: AAA family ATPase [Acidobacteria bacterium]|nr:AAA family ATPase [Acidobacteriota bacterium]
MTRILTFYSYKGGVGRTMALVNAAYVLAQGGYRVLMVDLDLEAPGMTHFFAESIRSQKGKGLRDSIDLLLAAKQTLAEADSSDHPPEIPNSLEDFVVTVGLPQEWRQTIPYLNGRLDLLPARIDSPAADLSTAKDYLERLDDLDLAEIFSPGGPGHQFGAHLREYFRQARFTAPGDPFFVIREEARVSYDVVLIDSRTGLNEIAGLCIGPLCDGLVVCCGLNRQNIAGAKYFLEKAGLLESVKGKPYIVVAGPVPVWQKRETRERISAIRQSLGKELIVEVPYHPAAAVAETVFVTDPEEPEEAISAAYRSLAREIRRVFLGAADQEPRRLDLGWDEIHDSRDARARALIEYLRRRRVWPLERPGSALCRFPTASAMAGMPAGDSSAPQPEPYALAAAVASYRAGSDRAFRRAWDLLNSGVAMRLSPTISKLALLELRIFGTFRGSPEDVETIRSIGQDRDQRNDLRLEYLLALHLLDYGDPEIDKEILKLTQSWFSQPEFQPEWWGRNGVDLLSLLLAGDLNRDQLKGLERAVSKLPKELLTGDFSRPDLAPFGFWPESLLISALSVIKEEKGVGEVLKLIRALRDRYGYAWRVLVDWRRLAKVKDQPLFQQFIREEDEMVEEIESAIDQGVYPL